MSSGETAGADAIFVLDNAGHLHAMEKGGYVSEDRLQELLAAHPDLLAGAQIDRNEPRRWLLVSREVGVPAEEDGGARWSVDHLFLDQDGVPTLVEVKRASDTRIRREVVGQLLEYAANAQAYWPAGFIRGCFEGECEKQEASPEEEVQSLVDGLMPYDEYWERVDTNLQAGRVRLLFVADALPPELQQVIEFLNTQMSPAQVLGVEVPQYVGSDMRTLVPRVVGQTASAARAKGTPRAKRKWDEESFFAELATSAPASAVEAAKRILDWARSRNLLIWWGEGAHHGSFVPVAIVDGQRHQLFAVWTTFGIEIYFYWYAYKAPFTESAARLEIARRLSRIDGVELTEAHINKRPSFPLELLASEEAWSLFLETYDWFLEQVGAGSDASRKAER